ncbi:MAG: hypothetical protein H6811_11430 [Phycisphaeraceae bacterium]|nr:hypothetical protein [Phycisphaeraceae bacterium]
MNPLGDDLWDDEPGTPAAPKPAPASPAPPVPTVEGTRGRPTGYRFVMDLDVTELDDRGRPGPQWVCRSQELSRSHVVIVSRRMVYPGRTLVLAVHKVDDTPTILCGCVITCEYAEEGLCRIDIDLRPVPKTESLDRWVRSQTAA